MLDHESEDSNDSGGDVKVPRFYVLKFVDSKCNLLTIINNMCYYCNFNKVLLILLLVLSYYPKSNKLTSYDTL